MLRASSILRRFLRSSGGGAAAATSGPKDKLSLTFSSPSNIVADAEAFRVSISTHSGDFTAMAETQPFIAQLRPGVVEVDYEQGQPGEKYFVPGGFAVVHEDSSMGITASEIFPLEDLDANKVQAELANLQTALSGEQDETKKAEINIGIETYEAMAYALK